MITLIRFAGICLILWGVLIGAVPLLLPYAVALSPNHEVVIDEADDPDRAELDAQHVARHLRIPVGPPDASLSCFVMDPEPEAEPAGTILLLHGHRDNKSELMFVARELIGIGYRTVLVDLRGHGLSSGDYLSFGAFESNDLIQVLDTLEDNGLLAGSVGVLGFSFGGAAGIQLAAKDTRVKAVASISTFRSLRIVVGDYVACFLPMVRPFLSEQRIQHAVDRAGEMGGFDPDDADTERAASALQVPLLVIHGEEDRRIPISHARCLCDTAGDVSRLIAIPGKGHGNIFTGESRVTILLEIFNWFEQYLRTPDGQSSEGEGEEF